MQTKSTSTMNITFPLGLAPTSMATKWPNAFKKAMKLMLVAMVLAPKSYLIKARTINDKWETSTRKRVTLSLSVRTTNPCI